MPEIDDYYFECPFCHYIIKFRYDEEIEKYVSMCPYCENYLEIDKDEYEDDSEDIEEKYFEFD